MATKSSLWLRFFLCLQVSSQMWLVQGNLKKRTAVQGVLGTTAQIPCEVEMPSNVIFVIWTKGHNDTQIYIYDTRKVPLGKEGEHHTEAERLKFKALAVPPYLAILNVEAGDEGTYACEVVSLRERTRTSEATLRVIVPPGPIKILDSTGLPVEDPLDSLQENSTVQFFCQVTGGRPRPQIAWYKEAQLLDDEIEYEEGDDLRNKLVIGPVSRDDHGKVFTCQTWNSNMTARTSQKITLDVSYAPLTVEFLTAETALVADVQVALRCKSDGARPSAVVSWWFEGRQLLTGTEDYTTNSGNTTISTLYFIPTHKDGGKVLVCRSQSPNVTHPPLVTRRILDINYPPLVTLTMTPSDKEELKEGESATLECNATSNPKTTNVNWFHKSRQIHNKPKKGIQIEGNLLTLSNLTRKMSGLYSCVADNEVGMGNSNGVVLHVQYAPVCGIEGLQIVGATMKETMSVICSLKASPKVTSFRWQFSNAKEVNDIAEDHFLTNEKHSVLSYTPKMEKDFGTLKCWGTNELGEQDLPCVFQLVEAALPDKPTNCTFLKNYTSSSVFVQCVAGRDGGLPQSFVATVFDMYKKVNARNVTFEKPFFAIQNLPSGTDFLLTIFSTNGMGDSETQNLQVYTAVPTETGPLPIPGVFPITYILGVLIGVVGALVIVAITVPVVMKLRTDPTKRKQGLPPPGARNYYRPRDGGETGGFENNGRTEDEMAVDGIPAKFKHANIYETVSYSETAEDGKQTEILSEKPNENKDAEGVEYAELNFANCRKKTKAKKPKSEKKSPKTNGKIQSSYDPTLYASIDHVQTEKQKLAAAKQQQRQEKKNNNNPPKSKAPNPHQQLRQYDSSPSPPSPPPPLGALAPLGIPPQQPPIHPNTQTVDGNLTPQEIGPRKSTGKPTNLDKPAIAKKPTFPQDNLSRKKTAETQTTEMLASLGDLSDAPLVDDESSL